MIAGGGTPSSSEPQNWDNGEVVWITPTDFSRANGGIEISDSERKITLGGLKSSAATLLPKGTVIMASRATIGSVRIAGVALTTNQGFISFVCDHSKIYNRFLYYVITGYLGKYFAEVAPGTTFNEISRGDAKQEAIGFPPHVEQQRIAAYLDASCAAIDAAVAAKRQQIATLDAVRETLIESAVTRGLRRQTPMRVVNQDWITEIPEYWDVCRIKRIMSRIDYGISESTEPEGRFPVLKMGHIECGEIEFRNLDFVENVADDLLLETGDILYNRTNSPDRVGKAAIFRGNRSDAITFASYLVRLRTNHRADPYFLNYLVNNRSFLSFARKLAIPSVQQSNLNSTRYCRILIPLPPIQEQREIVAYLEKKLGEMRCVVSSIESQICALTAYRNSLIHECVTGKRRVREKDSQRILAYA
jgi:type I restriction enzyme S subunit